LTHVGRPHLPPVSEPVDQAPFAALDTEQSVVKELVVDVAHGKQIFLGVVSAVPAVGQVVKVQPEAVAAARHLAAVVVALQHGPAGGGRDEVR